MSDSLIVRLIKEGRTLWAEAKATIEGWASAVSKQDPGLVAVAGTLMGDVKVAASRAIDLGESALGNVLLPAIVGIEPVLDQALKTYLGPVGLIAAPLVHDTVDQIAQHLHDLVNAWSLKAKASLVVPGSAPASAKVPGSAN